MVRWCDGVISCCDVWWHWWATVSNEQSVVADFGGKMIMICIRICNRIFMDLCAMISRFRVQNTLS